MKVPAELWEAVSRVFGSVPSVTICNGQYAMVVKGRLFLWDDADECLRILLSVPLPNGAIDLVTVPEPVTDRMSLKHAVEAADKLFRGMALWPSAPQSWGIEVEDLIAQICERLGFVHVTLARPGNRFTVRHGSPREDTEDKIDLVLTIPALNSDVDDVNIPIQLTALNGSRNLLRKSSDLVGRGVVFVSMGSFCPRAQQPDCLRQAAAEDRLELWFMSQVIKGAIHVHTGRNVTFPREPSLDPTDISSPMFARFLERMATGVRDEIKVIMKGPRQARERKGTEVLRYLENRWSQGDPLLPANLYKL